MRAVLMEMSRLFNSDGLSAHSADGGGDDDHDHHV